MNSKNTSYITAIFFLMFIAILCTVALARLFRMPIDSDSDVLHTTITSVSVSNTATLSTTTTTGTTTTETTTITTTTTVTTTTTTELPVIETTVDTTATESYVVSDQSDSCRMVYDAVHKVFSRGTYYCGSYGTYGGSLRQLIDCSVGDGIIKGSVASHFLWSELGYNLNGNRTVVYVEVPDFPEMNGLYYVDDCSAANDEIIDFFYTDASHCPFQNIGVITVKCYLINEEY